MLQKDEHTFSVLCVATTLRLYCLALGAVVEGAEDRVGGQEGWQSCKQCLMTVLSPLGGGAALAVATDRPARRCRQLVCSHSAGPPVFLRRCCRTPAATETAMHATRRAARSVWRRIVLWRAETVYSGGASALR